MLWKALADAVLFIHALWVLAIVFGPLWCLRRPRWRGVHLGMMVLVLLFALVFGGCPLTGLENALWRKGEPSRMYPGGFIAHYVLSRIVYWDYPRSLMTGICAGWFLLWSGIYAWLWRRRKSG
jgi:hypothetical protein